MTGELKINGKDAYTTWGIVPERGNLSGLMTPPSGKPYLENKSSMEHGKTVYVANNGILMDERSIQLAVSFIASSELQFYQRYNSFCEELMKGRLWIETIYQPGVIYKCVYESCQNYASYDGKMAKFVLKLNEPNPNDRNNDNNL